MIWRGVLRSFDGAGLVAVVEFSGSWAFTVGAVPVSRAIDQALMVPGRKVMVAVIDPSDPGSMMVLGVR